MDGGIVTNRRFRFAPSPNGRLHLGHAYSALLNRQLAVTHAGDLLLRIEDIDTVRCTPFFETAIGQDLAWLGIDWSGRVRRQSEHFDFYRTVLDGLGDRNLLYPCFCTRGDVARAITTFPAAAAGGGRGAGWPTDPDGSPLYPGTCRRLTDAERRRLREEGRPYVLRLDMATALAVARRPLHWMEYREGSEPRRVDADPSAWGDAVLCRKDIPASYHVAVVADDELQRITDIVRGADLLAATSLHRLLQELLKFGAPAYHHHALVLGADGLKLSKSRNSPTLAELRRNGTTPEDVKRFVGLSGNG